MRRQVNIQEATHVRTGNLIEKIVDKYGVSPEGHLAPPSKGGFGVFTLSGREIKMLQADEYLQEEESDSNTSALQAVTEAGQHDGDWHNTETQERFGTIDLTLVAAAYADCYEVARGHQKSDGFRKHGADQMYWKGRSDAATEIRLKTPHNAKLMLNKLVNQAKTKQADDHVKQIQVHINEFLSTGTMNCDADCPEAILIRTFAARVRLDEAKWRLNHWPPFGVLVGSQNRQTAVEAYEQWINKRADEQRERIAELQIVLAGCTGA